LCLCAFTAFAQKADTLRFPLKDRRGDPFTWNYRNAFDLSDSSFLKDSIQYDPVTRQFYIIEKIGDISYRKPTYLTFDEFWRLQARQSEIDYFSQRSQTLFDLNRKVQRPKPRMYDQLFDRIFGVGPQGMKVDIKPEGTVDLTMGYQGQKIFKKPHTARKCKKKWWLRFQYEFQCKYYGKHWG